MCWGWCCTRTTLHILTSKFSPKDALVLLLFLHPLFLSLQFPSSPFQTRLGVLGECVIYGSLPSLYPSAPNAISGFSVHATVRKNPRALKSTHRKSFLGGGGGLVGRGWWTHSPCSTAWNTWFYQRSLPTRPPAATPTEQIVLGVGSLSIQVGGLGTAWKNVMDGPARAPG